jgi:hypothetical protein
MEKTPEPEMTKEEKRFLIRALWDALLAPRWTKDALVDFGMAIFSKKTLKEMDDKIFDKIFPFLETITTKLWQLLGNEAARQATIIEKKPEPEAEPKADDKTEKEETTP